MRAPSNSAAPTAAAHRGQQRAQDDDGGRRAVPQTQTSSCSAEEEQTGIVRLAPNFPLIVLVTVLPVAATPSEMHITRLATLALLRFVVRHRTPIHTWTGQEAAVFDPETSAWPPVKTDNATAVVSPPGKAM